MEFALWAYPWDLLDEGVESVAERCAEIGVGEINLATNYHSVQPFLPHNPERKTFFAHASSYFHPDEERYGRLSPVPNETMGEEDWLDRIADEIADTHLSLNSWTIGCHNSRLGLANPDLTLESPFGDSLAFGLCPSRPEVQTFLRSLLSDLSARAPFDRIELETFDYFYGTGFGWHHDKYHVDLGRLGEFLFGLCFCEECRANAAAAGVDVETARESARDGLNAIIAGDLGSDVHARDWVRDHPVLAAYVDARMATLTDLYADLRSAVDEDVDLGRYAGFFDVDDAWMHGADLDALADHLDYYTVIAYESTPAAAVQRVETVTELVPDATLHAGVLPGHPAIDDAGTVRDVVDGLADAGTERISFYNYGLLPERNLEWIGAATSPHR